MDEDGNMASFELTISIKKHHLPSSMFIQCKTVFYLKEIEIIEWRVLFQLCYNTWVWSIGSYINIAEINCVMIERKFICFIKFRYLVYHEYQSVIRNESIHKKLSILCEFKRMESIIMYILNRLERY